MTVAKKRKLVESYAKAKINASEKDDQGDGNSQKKCTIEDYYY